MQKGNMAGEQNAESAAKEGDPHAPITAHKHQSAARQTDDSGSLRVRAQSKCAALLCGGSAWRRQVNGALIKHRHSFNHLLYLKNKELQRETFRFHYVFHRDTKLIKCAALARQTYAKAVKCLI